MSVESYENPPSDLVTIRGCSCFELGGKITWPARQQRARRIKKVSSGGSGSGAWRLRAVGELGEPDLLEVRDDGRDVLIVERLAHLGQPHVQTRVHLGTRAEDVRVCRHADRMGEGSVLRLLELAARDVTDLLPRGARPAVAALQSDDLLMSELLECLVLVEHVLRFLVELLQVADRRRGGRVVGEDLPRGGR